MTNPVLLQFIALASLFAVYTFVGATISRGLLSHLNWRSRLGFALMVGFPATPLLTGVIAVVLCRGALTPAVFLLLGACAGVQLVLTARRRWASPSPAAPPAAAAGPDGSLFPDGFPVYVIAVATTLAVLASVGYLAWSLELRATGGRVYAGTNVFDFEKHLMIFNSLALDGLPPQSPNLPGVPVLYYTGFYITPAALAPTLSPASLHFLVAQWLLACWVFVTVAYRLVADVCPRWRLPGLVFIGVAGGAMVWPGGEWADKLQALPYASLFKPEDLWVRSAVGLMIWVPHHMVSLVYAVWVLSRLNEAWKLSRAPLQHWLVLSLCGAFVLAASTFVGFIFCLCLACFGVRLAVRWLWSRVARVDASRPTGIAWFVGSLVLLGVLNLPVYWPIVRARLAGSLDHGSVFIWTEDWGVGVRGLVQSCGLPVILLALAVPFLRRLRIPFEVWVMGMAAVLLSVAMHQLSDLGAKMAYVAMVVSCLVAVAMASGLLTAHSRACRVGGVFLAGLLGVNALVSMTLGGHWTYTTLEYTPTVSRDELSLLRWVRTNTNVRQRVTHLGPDRANYYYLLARPAVASGADMVPRLQAVFIDARALREYQLHHAQMLTDIQQSDYLYVTTELAGWGYCGKLPMNGVESYRLRLPELGFEVAYETPAGYVARRTEGNKPTAHYATKRD